MLWGLQRVEAQAAYGLAVSRIRDQIHAGLLLPTEKLPAERQLSDDFGISRVTLREALRVLETDRYITVRRGAHGGAFVAESGQLEKIATRRIAREPAASMRVLEFLCANERAATDYAVDRRGVTELKQMRKALEVMAGSPPPELRKQAETLFHYALSDASHNKLFAQSITNAISELFLPADPPSTERDRQNTLEAYRDFLAALETGDREKAQAALTRIHDFWWANVRVLSRAAA